jgi:hypothetical protein
MPSAQSQLNSPFRRAMLYVVQELGEVGVMKLEKILYLADLEHFHRTGHRITGAKWVRQKLGPVAKTVLPSTTLMRGHEISVTEEHVSGHPSSVYRLGPSPRFSPNLSADEKATLDRVISLVKSLSATDAAKLTYQTTPMLARLQVEEAAGREILDEPLVFERRPREVARLAARTPRASLERRRAFKRAELARIEDLNAAAVARASER